ncbi:hypothetical protein [Sporosarcina aquimarina]|uniref:hypothetical protein n=1 Tax=Sporosarcina aquimarina TaxID=114975 RepID=UPI001C8E2C4B|nr:hypothetical protein [Sporosarcina aquimarina]MBY0221965.1 hypothetical protein [Sporosarcina aquimarina]
METENVEVEEVEVTEQQPESPEAEAPTVDEMEQTQKENERLVEELNHKLDNLFSKQVTLTLSQHGLEAFKDIVHVSTPEELESAVQKLTAIVNGIKNEAKVSAGYVPKDNLKQDSYNVAKEKGDTKSMIKALFGKR